MAHRRHILNHTWPPCYHEKDLKSNEGTGLHTPEVSTAIFAFHKELQSQLLGHKLGLVETVPATECIGDLLRGVWLVILLD